MRDFPFFMAGIRAHIKEASVTWMARYNTDVAEKSAALSDFCVHIRPACGMLLVHAFEMWFCDQIYTDQETPLYVYVILLFKTVPS